MSIVDEAAGLADASPHERELRFADTFTGFSSRFGQYDVEQVEASGKHKGRANTLTRGGPTLDDYRAHLAGVQRMGVVPLMDDGESVRFAAIDVDRYPNGQQWPKGEEDPDAILKALATATADLPIIITRSKSGGSHVWFFSPEPVSARLVFRALKDLAGSLGYGAAEIFPKQVRRTDPTETGNWINLPFYGDTCQMFVANNKGEFETLGLDKFLKLVDTITMKEIEAFIEPHDYEAAATPPRRGTATRQKDPSGPPTTPTDRLASPRSSRTAWWTATATRSCSRRRPT